MVEPNDDNAELWRSAEVVREWTDNAAQHERRRAWIRRFMTELLPFDTAKAFTFLDLGAGTGAAAQAILDRFPKSTAVLADFSLEMMAAGEESLERFAGRYRYVEFDMTRGEWPGAIPTGLDAVVTSLCVHHLSDERKRGLFAEVHERLASGGWYLNYDPVRTDDPVVEAAWQRTGARLDPALFEARAHRTPQQQVGWDNHVRFLAPLEPQLAALREIGFAGVEVYWRQLEDVIFGGSRA